MQIFITLKVQAYYLALNNLGKFYIYFG